MIKFIHGLDYTNKRHQYLLKEFGNKKYKKHIVNKWHLVAFLMKNPILLMFRKKNFIAKKINENVISIEELIHSNSSTTINKENFSVLKI